MATSPLTMMAPLPSLSSAHLAQRTISKVASTSITASAFQCSVRHKSTTRRMTKALRLHPHGSFIGTASTIPSQSSHLSSPLSNVQTSTSTSTSLPTIIHNPPSAAPSPLITPRLFIPPEDPRYSAPSPTAILTSAPTTAPAPREGAPGSGTAAGKLPPALVRPYQKTYHLTEEDIKEIQRLRGSEPDVWTRRKLADKFGCSEFFVGMVAPTTDERKAAMKVKQEEVKNKWGRVRTFAREERTRRRELWSKDL